MLWHKYKTFLYFIISSKGGLVCGFLNWYLYMYLGRIIIILHKSIPDTRVVSTQPRSFRFFSGEKLSCRFEVGVIKSYCNYVLKGNIHKLLFHNSIMKKNVYWPKFMILFYLLIQTDLPFWGVDHFLGFSDEFQCTKYFPC